MAVSLDQLQKEIQRAIDEEPTVGDAANISVLTERKGSLFAKKERVVLTGSVRNENEKSKIEQIAKNHAGAREVVNSIKISRR